MFSVADAFTVVVAVVLTGRPSTLSMESTAAVFVTTPVTALPTRATTVTVRVVGAYDLLAGAVIGMPSLPMNVQVTLRVLYG